MAASNGSAVFASYNIHKCVGSDRRFDPERVMAVIGEIDADIIALQETDRRFGDRAGLLDLPALARDTGLVPVPVSNGHEGHGWHGNLVLVRGGTVRKVHQVTLPGLEPRGALVADIDLPMGSVRVVAAHLGLLRQSRLLQIEALLTHARESTGLPVVMMGDLNEWRRKGRSALNRFQPVFGPVGRGVPSFPAYFPVLALDRVLSLPREIIDSTEAHDTPLSRLASDHLPVKARVRLGAPLPETTAPPRPARRRAAAPPLAGTLPRRGASGPMTPLHRTLAAALLLAGLATPALAVPFSRADANGDGVVTWPEAQKVFPRLKKIHFDKCDPGGDGLLDQGEFTLLNNFYWINYVQSN